MKNKLMKKEGSIIRILEEKDNRVFVIDCVKKTMPYWCDLSSLSDYEICCEEFETFTEELSAAQKRIMHERYTLIAGILPFASDEKLRSVMISKVAEQYKVSKQTIRKYLCMYLVYQDISVLAPDKKENTRELTVDEKNIRWALNKFFYTKNKNSLKTAYTMMLKEKYCDNLGNLNSHYPTFYQFRYYYRKHRSMQKFYISRDGLSDYQRNSRPLTGNGIQEFASSVGVGMLDSTICDIYLVNESGGLVGALTQLINNSGISICMVGTPESNIFFEQAMQLARRSLGLQYGAMKYDDTFREFCRTLFSYRYVKYESNLTEGIISWLYEHSGGITSVVVSLIHDAQELAILNGSEKLDLNNLTEAYKKRLSLLHGYIKPQKPLRTIFKGGKGMDEEKDKNVSERLKTLNLMQGILSESKSSQKDILTLVKEKINVEEIRI